MNAGRSGLLVLIMLCGIFARGHTTTLGPVLNQLVIQSTVDTLIPVMIRPHGTISGAALKRQVAAQYATRAERHRAVITQLQNVAATKQPPVLDALNEPQFAGRVTAVRSYWIDNAITASMTPTAIAELSNRPEIAEVLYLPPVEFFGDGEGGETIASPAVAGTAQPGLLAIKADSLWRLGYTGKGRLVGSIDTGFEGDHPFLTDKWRGHNGYSLEESWFDPKLEDTIPQVNPDYFTDHGTQVVGIMVAIQDTEVFGDSTLDTVGVAIDAQWIAAGVISPAVSHVLDGMQWMADPDGDPNTETDVPDAICNSWGIPNHFIGCSEIFWNAIDNVEAAGAAMIFAAGNFGLSGPSGIVNPANRGSSLGNSFAVGMINPHDPAFPIDPLSSRGPSDCDGTTIKPDVVASGVDIQTTKSGGLMSQAIDGTSFATPHVASGIALLREYNPNLTVDEIKSALISSAIDLGDPGPDNYYGYGLIDLAAALEVLPPNDQPELYIKRDYYERPSPGTSTDMIIVLKSAGTPVSNVTVDVISEDPHLSVTSGHAAFGDFDAMGDTSGNFAAPFVLAVDGSVLAGQRLPMRFEINGDSYAKTVKGALQIGPTQVADLFTHDAGNFIMSVGTMGQFGLHPQSVSPRTGGMGYLYGGDATQSLYEGSFLVGVGPDQVSDNARSQLTIMDADFQVDPGGYLQVTEGGLEFAEETRAAYSDAVADNPIGLFIEQRSRVYADPETHDCLILEFTIHNQSGTPLSDLHAGLFFDWDFPYPSGAWDRGSYNANAEVGCMYQNGAERCRGLTVLNPEGLSGYQHYRNGSDLSANDTKGLTLSEFSDAEKWDAMIGPVNPNVPSSAEDGSHLIATGPFTLQPEESIVAAFAVIGGVSEFDVALSAVDARIRWSGLCDCPYQSDFNADGSLDALDMHALIDVLFANGADIVDALCPATRADFNNDGFPDAVDMALMIDHLFAGGDPPLDPCLP